MYNTIIEHNDVILNDPIDFVTTSDVSLVPQFGLLSSRDEALIDIPFLCSAPMDSVGGLTLVKNVLAHGQLAVVSRFLSDEEYIEALQYSQNCPNRENLFFAVGTKSRERVLMDKAGLSLEEISSLGICLDIAHGYSVHGIIPFRDYGKDMQRTGHTMTGSICTEEAAIALIELGYDTLRVGIGPGRLCTTRVKTGVGTPNLSSIYKINKAISKMKKKNPKLSALVIADGGISEPGEVVKYFAAGASCVMLGSEFAHAIESPNGEAESKMLKGQASRLHKIETSKHTSYVEGISIEIVPDTSVEQIIKRYEEGIRSAISYLGATCLTDLSPYFCKFVKITNSGYYEGLSVEAK